MGTMGPVNPADLPDHHPRSVRFDPDGLTVTDDTRAEAVLTADWPDVVEVVGYVVDIVVEQSLVLDFSLANGESIEVTDHMDGWDVATRDLGEHLPLLVDDLPATLAALTADDDVLVLVRRHANDEVP